jgi:arginine N-succinyltransferase
VSFRVRPARNEDFEGFYELAKLTGGGFTNLPADKGALTQKLARSDDAFSRETEATQGDLFVFMLEEVETGRIRGTCQIFSRVGLDPEHPFYSYRISELKQTSAELDRTFRTEVLTLCSDFNGCSEVGGLFLHPDFRSGGLGVLLARSRYLFMKRHRERFAGKVVAELRGVIEESGRSAFWDAIAGRFFGMTFRDADAFNAAHGTRFIADLMPKTPIYTAMLPQDALEVMRQPSGEAAKRMLEEEGFIGGEYVDIFDGGPTMYAATDDIRTIRNARELVLADTRKDGNGQRMTLACGRLRGFASCFGQVAMAGEGTATLDPRSAALLGIEPGQTFLAMGR